MTELNCASKNDKKDHKLDEKEWGSMVEKALGEKTDRHPSDENFINYSKFLEYMQI